MSEYFPKPKPLYNYVAKTDLKNETDVDTSKLLKSFI